MKCPKSLACALILGLLPFSLLARAAEKQPIEVVEDNSFLIEEAYNQEPGVVQHSFSAAYNSDSRRRGWTFNFTQEWPVFSQDHQISYAVPSYHFVEGPDQIRGLGDITLSYRYQAFDEGELKPAFAPEFSLILPTGNRNRGTGDGVVGYQGTLPFSKKLTSRFAMHANLGVTYLPHVRARLGGSTGPLSPRRSLVSYNLGASGVFAIVPRFHLMLEWVGDFEESINDGGKAVRAFQPVIAPGFRTALVNQEKLQVVVGAATPIGLTRKADNYGALLYLSIEHGFH
jgi:Putative MetA-pathway of phenol degradation